MSALNMNQIRFCAEECERQRNVGPVGVFHMCAALDSASRVKVLSTRNIAHLGRLVEPTLNAGGFRRVPVYFDKGSPALPAALIEGTLERLLDALHQITAEEFYREFQHIHPFIDGNGRVGAILYNWRRNTLDHPIPAPELLFTGGQFDVQEGKE